MGHGVGRAGPLLTGHKGGAVVESKGRGRIRANTGLATSCLHPPAGEVQRDGDQ